MRDGSTIEVSCLGQSGVRLGFAGCVLYVDPYLSDRVAELYGKDLRRLRPVPVQPGEVSDANWVLISHDHEDHCDPATLLPLCAASPGASVIGPQPALSILRAAGIPPSRLQEAEVGRWRQLAPEVELRPVPAAHPTPEQDEHGHWSCLGFLLRLGRRLIYHSGDTSPHPVVFESLAEWLPIDIAFLPVNERNYYRDQRGIIGNMSIREAFQMATDLGARTLVPIHWDLFSPNSVSREELALVYSLERPPLRLEIEPTSL